MLQNVFNNRIKNSVKQIKDQELINISDKILANIKYGLKRKINYLNYYRSQAVIDCTK